MQVTVSALRSNIYRLLDGVVLGGAPIVVVRKGRRLRIVRDDDSGRLARLTPHRCINTDPEKLVHMDWSGEWKNGLP